MFIKWMRGKKISSDMVPEKYFEYNTKPLISERAIKEVFLHCSHKVSHILELFFFLFLMILAGLFSGFSMHLEE